MANPSRFVNQYTALKGFKNNAILNGKLVKIESYDNIAQKFIVREVHINNGNKSESRLVKLAHLECGAKNDFRGRFPSAAVVQGSHGMETAPVGSIVIIGKDTPPEDFKCPLLSVTGCCRFVGYAPEYPTTDDGKKVVMKLDSLIPNMVHIEAEHDDDIIEFENIILDTLNELDEQSVTCVRGNIIFRNCLFNGSGNGLIVGDGRFSVNVMLENCYFIEQPGCGVIVNSGNLTMYMCRIKDVGVGACIRGNSTLVAKNCFFRDSMCGVIVANQAHATLSGCRGMAIIDSSFVARNGSTLTISDCLMHSCGVSGILVEGSGTTARLKNCYIEDSEAGIRICSGEVDTEITYLEKANCTVGIFVAGDVAGRVAVSEYRLQRDSDFVNLSLQKDLIFYNGRVFNGGLSTWTHTVNSNREIFLENMELYCNARGKTVRRHMANMELITIYCNKCRVVEEEGTEFQQCGGCKYVSYCSKACQKEQWKAHKKSCHRYRHRKEIIATKGFLACAFCNRAEPITCSDFTSSVCESCCKVFYCDRACRLQHQAEHQLVCETLV